MTTIVPTVSAKVAALSGFCFDRRYEAVHAPVRQLLFDEVFDRRTGLTSDEKGRLAYERARFIGVHSLKPSVAAARIHDLCALAEWPGLCDVSVFSILMVHYNLVVGTIVDRMVPSPYVDAALDALDGFTAFGPYLATELGYGNDVAGLKTVAIYDPATDCFLLDTPNVLAAKYMSYSGFSDIDKIAVVLARTVIAGRDVGVFPFLAPLVSGGAVLPGVNCAPCPEKPVQGLDNGITSFASYPIPRAGWLHKGLGYLSESGGFVPEMRNPRRRLLGAMSRIIPGRLCVASSALGAAKASLFIALTYSRNRMTNAPGSGRHRIRGFLQYQVELYPALAATFAFIAQVNALKGRYVQSPDDAQLQREISATKAIVTLRVRDIVTICRERCGAQGMFSANRIADYVSLLQGLVTAEGDSQVLLGVMAVQLLQDETGRDAELVVSGGPPYFVSLLAHRTILIERRYQELRSRTAESLSVFESMNRSLPVALDFGAAWIAERSTGALLAGAERVDNSEARRALRRLAELYALSELVRDSVDLVGSGHVAVHEPIGWRDRIGELCAELDKDVDDLITAFHLVPELLRAPIAVDDYASAFVDACGVRAPTTGSAGAR